MRASEWIIAVFFTWSTILAVTLPLRISAVERILLVNAAVFLLYVIVWRLRRRAWVDYARDWIPQAMAMVAYQQMGLFAARAPQHLLESKWIVFDRLLLDTFHLRAALESLGVVIPFLLELSYLFVYAVPPITMGILYALGERRKADLVLAIYLIALFLCYGQFPFWPSEPPRVVFAGQDLPNFSTPVRDLNLWLVGNGGIHTSVFPSAHVSGVFAVALGLLYVVPKRRKLIAAYCVYAILVALATVYGRYHYAVDALAGAVIGVLAPPLGAWLWRLVNKRQPIRETVEARDPVTDRAGV
jgi:membrane-associated phospholipid phosphatase